MPVYPVQSFPSHVAFDLFSGWYRGYAVRNRNVQVPVLHVFNDSILLNMMICYIYTIFWSELC